MVNKSSPRSCTWIQLCEADFWMLAYVSETSLGRCSKDLGWNGKQTASCEMTGLSTYSNDC